MRLLLVSVGAMTLALAAAEAQRAPEAVRPSVDGLDRVVITGMAPIPNVGEGAPLFTSQDLTDMAASARDTMNRAQRDHIRCRGRGQLVEDPVEGSEERADFTSILLRPHEKAGKPSTANLLALEYETARAVEKMAEKAHAATVLAEQARRDVGAGKVDQAAVEAAELKRQEAVRELQKARAELVEAQAVMGDLQYLFERDRDWAGWVELDARALERKQDNVGLGIAAPADVPELDIRNIKATQVKDRKGGELVLVEGEIVNVGKKGAHVPALSVALIDERGWVLTNSTMTSHYNTSIGRGKKKPFRVEVRPAPEALHTAVVSWAPEHHVEPRLNIHCSGGPRG